MNKIILKKNREKPVLAYHPWIFSGAIAQTDPLISPGDFVKIYDHDSNFLAHGYYNPESQICIRLFDWNLDIDPETRLLNNLKTAIKARDSLLDSENDCCRLVYSEGDSLPGLIVDKYAQYLVIQILTLGMEKRKQAIIHKLLELVSGCKGILERSDVPNRRQEGLETISQVTWGKIPNGPVLTRQNGLQISVDIRSGQKTGAYLDQKANNALIAKYAKGKSILDCFCYTGSFALECCRAKAKQITCIDSSEPALRLAQQNYQQNHLHTPITFEKADVFEKLRDLKAKKTEFDLIILDPPKLTDSKNTVVKAARAYKDLNLSAVKLLTRGGMLAAFSCSGHIDKPLFQKIIWQACTDAGKQARIVERMTQHCDHPILLSFPQGEYLKGFLIQIV